MQGTRNHSRDSPRRSSKWVPPTARMCRSHICRRPVSQRADAHTLSLCAMRPQATLALSLPPPLCSPLQHTVKGLVKGLPPLAFSPHLPTSAHSLVLRPTPSPRRQLGCGVHAIAVRLYRVDRDDTAKIARALELGVISANMLIWVCFLPMTFTIYDSFVVPMVQFCWRSELSYSETCCQVTDRAPRRPIFHAPRPPCTHTFGIRPWQLRTCV